MQLIYSTHSTSQLKDMSSLPIILLNCRHTSGDLQCAMLVTANVALSGQCENVVGSLQPDSNFKPQNYSILKPVVLRLDQSIVYHWRESTALSSPTKDFTQLLFFFTFQVFPNQANLVHSKIYIAKRVLLSFSYVSLLEYITLHLPFICCPLKTDFFHNQTPKSQQDPLHFEKGRI